MRMLVGVVAVVGALATGGVPALAFTMGHAEQGVQTAGQAAVAQGPDKPADKNADGKPGYGPPAHASSRHNGDKPAKPDRADEKGDRGEAGERGKAGEAGAHGKEMSALGRAHATAMRDWAACDSEQPGNQAESFDPEAACGERPTPPGHLKHPAKHADKLTGKQR